MNETHTLQAVSAALHRRHEAIHASCGDIPGCPVCAMTCGYWTQKALKPEQLQAELKRMAHAFQQMCGLTDTVAMRYSVEIKCHEDSRTKQEIRSVVELPNGDILAADTNSQRLRHFSRSGQERVVASLSDGGRFFPVAQALLEGDYLAVGTRPAEKNLCGKIYIYNIRNWCLCGDPFGEFQHIRAICNASNDRLLVIESKVKKLWGYDIRGNLLSEKTMRDVGFPVGIATYKGQVFIADNENQVVQVFSLKDVFNLPSDEPLTPLRTIGQAALIYPYAIEINSQGLIFVSSNHGKTNIAVFDQSGNLLKRFFSEKKHTKMFAFKLLSDGASSAIAFESNSIYIYQHPLALHL